MSAQQRAIGDDNVIAQGGNRAPVAVGHQKVIVAQAGHAFSFSVARLIVTPSRSTLRRRFQRVSRCRGS